MTWAWPRSTCTYVQCTYYEGVAKHVVRRDTITMAEQRTAFKGSSSPIKGVHTVLYT